MKPGISAKSITLLAALILSNPALRAADPRPVPTIEKSSSGGVEVSSARGRWVKGRLLVSGVVHRKAGYSYPGPLQSHLDFIVLDSGQRTLSLSQTHYLPRPIPIVYRGIPSQATYAGYLPIALPAGATVRVAHHKASFEDCRSGRSTGGAQGSQHTRSERGK